MCYAAILVQTLACGLAGCPVLAVHIALGLEIVRLFLMVCFCIPTVLEPSCSHQDVPLHADLMIFFMDLTVALVNI